MFAAHTSHIRFFLYASIVTLTLATTWFLQPRGEALILALETILGKIVFTGNERLTHIQVQGNTYLPQTTILETIGLRRPAMPLSIIQVWHMRHHLQEVPFIHAVSVHLDAANSTLIIQMREKQPIAQLQTENIHALVDLEGHLLPLVGSQTSFDPFKALVRIEGIGAKEDLEYVSLFYNIWEKFFPGRYPIEKFIRVGQRRWDIYLANKQRIRLPEGAGRAIIERLIALDGRYHLIGNPNVQIIDLRLPQRVFIRHT